ncbi:HD-GYP domain-containing protein [Robertmurraya korlensis]|uniref:HD-GYP domain-containing protein n=1 Tax=Robertmurraya korlensis TaxID=519977 RepID=UPI000825DAEC|nr:HD-GYP domain-containing protein [Robertmurraya korlensis]
MNIKDNFKNSTYNLGGLLSLLVGLVLLFDHLYNEFTFVSLYVVIMILIGLAFSHKSNWFLISICLSIELGGILINGEDITIDYIDEALFFFIIDSTAMFISAYNARRFTVVKKHREEIVLSLAKALDARDAYTAKHSVNVAKYAVIIAQELKMRKEQIETIYVGGLLHDIGKIGVPEEILMKASRLTDQEFTRIKQHPLIGFETLKHIKSFERNGVLDIVLYHHERYDGKGYPEGLKGDKIPVFARIMAIADSFDAMTSQRAYRGPKDLSYAMNEIHRNKGTQFDPKIADIFLKVIAKDAGFLQIVND